MDHEAVRAALELAAVEPGGLDRLMAGDTPEAQAVAGHIAGCEACAEELGRIGRVGAAVRLAMAEVPSPELKAKTLAYVRERGVPRGDAASAATAAGAAAPTPAAPALAPATVTSIAAARDSRPARPAVIGWVAAIAAAVVLSVTATTLIVGSRVDDRLAQQDQAIEDLASVTTATLQVTSEPDAERVALDSPAGAATTGTLLYSPSTTDTVVVATGLTEPPAGMEYRCWVEIDGARQPVGKMFFGGGIAYWVGPAPSVAGLTGRRALRRLAHRCGRYPGRARPGPRRRLLGGRARRVIVRSGFGLRGGRIVGRWRLEVDPVQLEQPSGDLRADVAALAVHDARQPQRLAYPLGRLDVHVASPRVGEDEPDQSGSDHEPDDQQPPVEFRVHRSGVYGAPPPGAEP